MCEISESGKDLELGGEVVEVAGIGEIGSRGVKSKGVWGV